MSYEDAEEVLTEYAGAIKRNRFKNKTYEQWLAMTEEERETGKYLVSGVPNADGNVAINGMVKLWENPDPSVNFESQTITVPNAENYDLLYWEFQRKYGNTNKPTHIEKPTTSGFIVNAVYGEQDGIHDEHRTVRYNGSNSYLISGGYKVIGVSPETNNNNEYIIPIAIYGIKLNHTLTIDAIARDVSTSADKCMDSNNISVEERLNGIGTVSGIRLTSTDDLNDVYLNGFYSMKGSEIPANAPSARDYAMLVVSMNNVEVKQICYGTSSDIAGFTYERTAYWVSPGTERVWTTWKRTDAINSVSSGESRPVTSGAVYSYVDTMITQALNAGY